MKKLIMAVMVAGICGFQASAQDKQEKEEQRRMRVVVKTSEDGKETKVDTIINFTELEKKIEDIDFDAIIEEFVDDFEGNWKELSEDLQDMDINIKVAGEKHELEDLEDIAKWVGEAMEGVHFELTEGEEHVYIHCNDADTKSSVRVIVDEDSKDGIFIQEENVVVDIDEDGKGNIIVKSIGTNGKSEDVNVWIEDDGNVVVNGGSGSNSAHAKVKVMKLDNGQLLVSDGEEDDIDVKVITDDAGNSEARVIVKKVVRTETADYKNAPTLPNGLSLQVYPNPNNGQFQLTFRNDKKVKTSAVVYDSKGTEVYRNLIGKVDGLNKKPLDLSHLRSGNYILKLEQGKNTASEQFVIQ
jgi:tellurite resistance protein